MLAQRQVIEIGYEIRDAVIKMRSVAAELYDTEAQEQARAVYAAIDLLIAAQRSVANLT